MINDSFDKINYIGDKDLQPMSCKSAGITYPNPDYKVFYYPAKEYIFEFIRSGKGYIETLDGITEVSSGSLCVIKKGSNLTCYSSPDYPYEKIWVKLDGKTVGRLFDFFDLGDVFISNVNVLNIFLEIHDRLKRADDKSITEAYIDVLSLLFKILSLAEADYMFPKSTGEEKLCEKIRTFINSGIYSDISLDTISEHFSVSKMHIIRVFKQEYGVTPIQYMMDRKIEISRSLLKETVMPIKEIASLLNYSNAQHFSSSFKASEGCTPNQYRKNHSSTK